MDLAQDGVPEKGSSVPFGDFIAPARKAATASPAVAFLQAFDPDGWHKVVSREVV